MVTVHNQADLTAALANPRVSVIDIRSPEGTWLHIEGQRPGVRVVARDSSSVVARDSSRVEARDSSRVEAWGSSSIEASPHVAIHLHSARATVEGGVVINVTGADKTAVNWCEHRGIEVADGQAIVYKAVDDEFTTSRRFDYSPGSSLDAPDWRDDDSCGGGLHFGPTPRHAKDYFLAATRFVKVAIPLDRSRPISGGTAKIKAASCLVLSEVDIDGNEVVR